MLSILVIVIAILFQIGNSFHVSFLRNNINKQLTSSFLLHAQTQTWQQDVDTVLNIDTECDSRRNLTKGLLTKVEDIRDDVLSAIQDRDITKIAPPSLPYGKAVVGLKAFRRQVIEDIVPSLFTKVLPNVIKVGPKAVSAIIKNAPELSKELVSTARDLSQDASLLQSTVDDIRKEVRNVFRSTPVGLESPAYRVLTKNDAYEIRNYAAYSVATTKLSNIDATSVATTSSESTDAAASSVEHEILDPINSGSAFNILASYLFGKNVQKEKLAMTTPVIVEGETMEFVLPGGLTAATAPTPETNEVVIKDIASQVLAVREFPGFATEGEVSRQRAFLEDSLLSENIVYDNLSFKVFQYNPPQTLPWLRRNEVSVVVTYDGPVDVDVNNASSDSTPTSGFNSYPANDDPRGD